LIVFFNNFLIVVPWSFLDGCGYGNQAVKTHFHHSQSFLW